MLCHWYDLWFLLQGEGREPSGGPTFHEKNMLVNTAHKIFCLPSANWNPLHCSKMWAELRTQGLGKFSNYIVFLSIMESPKSINLYIDGTICVLDLLSSQWVILSWKNVGFGVKSNVIEHILSVWT